MDVFKELNAGWMKETRQEKIDYTGTERADKLISRGNGIKTTDGPHIELIPRSHKQ